LEQSRSLSFSFTRSRSSFLAFFLERQNRGAWWLLFAGIVIFSGSFVHDGIDRRALARRGQRRLAVLCFLAGWAWLAICPPKL